MVPEVAVLLDFSKAVSQNKELYVYKNKALHGFKKYVDHLFEVPFLNSTESAKILIHVELENNDDLAIMNQKAISGIHKQTIKKGKYFPTLEFNFMQWGLGNDDATQ
jgi:hypothetical protein